MYFDNDGNGSVSEKKPLRSCLKRESIDLTASLVATPSPNKKRVTFNFDDPPIGRPLTTDNTSTGYERPIVMGAFEHRAYLTGDLTCLAYERIKNALNDALRPRVLVCYQPGVTKKYIEYMLKYAWPVENANDKPIAIVTKYIEPSLVECTEDDGCVYIFWRPDHMQCRNICERFQHYHKAIAVILGDVNLMVQLPDDVRAEGSLPSFDKHVLRLAVTEHDMTRQGAYYREPSLRESLFNETGGIPLLIEENDQEISDKYAWIGQSKIFGRLFVLMMMNRLIEPRWRERKTGLSIVDLAAACGFTFNYKSVKGPNYCIDWLGGPSKVILCEKLKNLYCTLNPKIELLMRQTGVAGRVMENIVVENLKIEDPNQKASSYKVRYPFLATSFVAELPHEVWASHIGPKVTTKAEISKDRTNTTPDQLHPDDWKYYLPSTFRECVIHPSDTSHGPDAYISLGQSYTDKVPAHYVLCFQTEYGSEGLTLREMLDGLAKCPQVRITEQSNGKRTLAYDKRFIFRGQSVEYKLTFVYAAMNHGKVALKLQREDKCEVHEGYLRCTHDLFPEAIPEDVELILLLKQGLIQLLGSDMYSYLRSFQPATTISCGPLVINYPVREFPQYRDSDDKEAVLNEFSRICGSYKKLNIDLSGIKITPRPQTEQNSAQRLEENDQVVALLAEVQRLRAENEAHKNENVALRAENQRLSKLEKNKGLEQKNEDLEREPIPAVAPTPKEALAGSTPAKTQPKVGQAPSTAKPKKNPYIHVQSKVMAYVSESKEKKEEDKRGRGGVKLSNTNRRTNNTNAPK